MKVVKNIYSITLALLILLSTTGVMLINSYCSCSGASETAIYFDFDTECCDDHSTTPPMESCCVEDVAIKSCCASKKTSNENIDLKQKSDSSEKMCCNKPVEEDHDCNSSTHEYKKLEIDLLVTTQLQFVPAIVMINLGYDLIDASIEDNLNFALPRVITSPPSKLPSRQVLILHKQLKIASFS